MGCCISKCRSKKRSFDEINNQVEDKLVISQAPKTPNVPASNKISPSPPSPATSTSSSISSFTCTNSNSTILSSCSSLSSGSSISSSKDRSFSNEFLCSCVKENPHITRISSIKERSQLLASPTVRAKPTNKQGVAPEVLQRSVPQKVAPPQKRVRSNSPTTLTRQKSFRREPDHRLNPSYLRSPSPSRRFNNGDDGRGILTSTCTAKEIGCSKRMVGNSKVNAAHYPLRKEHMHKLASPYIDSSHQFRSCLSNRETCIHRISSKIDEVAVEEALGPQDSDAILMEDIDNPLISLDCFIFL